MQSSPQVSYKQTTSEVPMMHSGSISSSNNGSRKVSHEDIENVQNLIERCLQLYMDREEVVKFLINRARIDPFFTILVWQKLEEENVEFFKAYYIKLKLKRQITAFNQLLERQYYLMKRRVPPNAPYEIQHLQVDNLPVGYPVLQQPPISATGLPQIDSMHCKMSSCHVGNGILVPANFHPIHMNSENSTVIDGNSADSVPVISSKGVKSEMPFSPASVASNGHFPFTQSKISGMSVDASIFDSTFASDMASSEGLQLGSDNRTGNSKESLRSFAPFLWNPSHADLTADLPTLEDLRAVENYSGVPFLPDSDILLDSPEQNDIVEDYFADTVPSTGSHTDEGQSYLR